MSGATDLRQVEDYFLLCEVGKEKWSDADALAAILVKLWSDGYIEFKDKEIRLTEAGKHTLKSKAVIDYGVLRKYECDILKDVANDDKGDMISVVEATNFKEILTCSGLYKVEVTKGWLGSENKLYRSNNFDDIVRQIDLKKNRIENAIARHEPLDAKQLVEAYAFPSIAKSDGFKEYANRAASEAQVAAKFAVGMTAGVVASYMIHI